jgi:glycosyltransferase involved in cell wall biosynthesis
MSEKVKVLYFIDRMLRGGIQTFVIENMKHMDKNKIQIDYLLLDDGVKYELEDTLKEMGSNVYKLKGVWLRKPTDYFNYFKKIDEFFSQHNDYKVVHLHSSSKNFYILKSAKKYGIPVRIAHSHNIGFQSNNKIQIMIGNLCKPLLKKYATDYFACAYLAGEWLFGKKAVKDGKVRVIHNAVEYEKFKFNEEKRMEIRNRLNINDKLVIGNVGRFSEQKNHEFLIEIFSEIHKKNKMSTLMLIGKGEKEVLIRKKVRNLGLENDVIFMGFCNNVNELMWAMDIFLMPSLHEGLPVVGIEAQATGLPCFMSKYVITDEVKITELVKFIDLKQSSKEWAKEILNSDLNRKDTKAELEQAGYLIMDTAKELENFYRKV